jgi:cytoskeleton protein RodZ
VSLEEIARTTRVAQRYLESLEADAYDELPAPVFIRGFIRAYCQALGASPDDALTCYDTREGREPPSRPAPLPRAGAPEPRTRGAIVVSLVLLVVLGMALFTVALVIQPREDGQPSMPEGSPAPRPPDLTSEPTAPAPPAVTPPPTVPARTPPPTAAAPTPSVSRSAPPASTAPVMVPSLDALAGSVSAPYRLIARVSDPTWIRVRTEDGRTSEETVPAGGVREWVSERPFVVTIGNAGGVALELNGHRLPPLGARGAVVPRLVLPPEVR